MISYTVTKQQINMASSQHLSDSLRSLGFTSNEADVYAALIKESPSFVAPLVKETGKHRQMVYNALDALLRRNLISRSLKNGKFYYELSTPDRLVQLVKEQESIAQELAASISRQLKQPEEQVEVWRGSHSYIEALLSFRSLALEAQEYIIMNSIPSEFIAFTAEKMKQHMAALRALKDKGISPCLLVFGSVEGQLHQPSFWKYVDDPYESRLSRATPEPPQTIWIAGEHVYLRNHLEDPILIHIVSKDLAARYREYFYGYWNQAEPIHRPT